MNFKANESAQKLRGGYYTPHDLAVFLAQWILEVNPKHVLEPSCGDGVFLRALREAGAKSNLLVKGIELDAREATKARRTARDVGLKNVEVTTADFLGWALDNSTFDIPMFDAVLGNPPFIRYQYLPAPFQQRAEQIFDDLQLPFTKHTNAWVPFILASMKLLKPGGRLAMVVPSEIVHVLHAQSLRSYLGKECKRIVVVDPEALWFSDTLQGAVLLMTQKRSEPSERMDGLGIYQVKNKEFLSEAPSRVFASPRTINGKTVAGKWTRALLDQETLNLVNELEEHQEVYRFSDVADVDVGIVTGANKFFLVTNDTVRKNGLEKWAYPMFGRSEHCPGIIYDTNQHTVNAAVGLSTNFLWFPDEKPLRNQKVREYIEAGEAQDLHKRYKCRIREPWFAVPSVYSTEVGMLKRSNNLPRLILNEIRAYTTDTAYRIHTKNKLAPERLVSFFFNSITALSAELEGRHYGGGVLELVPSEIEKLMLPLPKKGNIDIKKLDKLIRTEPIQDALAVNSSVVLGNLGLSKTKQDVLMGGWSSLRNRRQRVSSESDSQDS